MSPLPQELFGRDDLLAAIHDRLNRPGTAPPRLLALHGLGGVGKTSVALEYARRHAGHYQLIWELPAEDRTLLSAGITDLARALGYTDLADVTDPVAIVHSALATRDSPWLLLLDNAPDAASVQHVVPPAGAGDVLVTSRSAHWPRGVGVEVAVLEPQVATELLLAGTEDDDAEAAAALAAALGSLPLALTQAAAYLRETGRSVAEYTSLLAGRTRLALLGRGEEAGYRDRVASTWSLAFERLAAEQPASVTLLRLLACSAPERIPFRVLLAPHSRGRIQDARIEAAVDLLQHDELVLDDAVRALRRFSLIGPPAQGATTVHRLVQAITLDQLPDDEERNAWRRATALLVEAALPGNPDDPSTWPEWAVLLPHALATLEPGSAGSLRLLGYLDAIGDVQTGRRMQADVHAALVDRLGPAHPSTLQAGVELARWTGEAGNPAAARDLLVRLMPQLQATFGPVDPVTLTARAHLADWTGRAGDWTGARDLAADVLEQRRLVSGDEHPDTLWVWGEYGFWTGQSGDPQGALAEYTRFLPVLERVLGPDHQQVLARRDQYARWVGETGNPARARDLSAAVLAQHERVTGPEHTGALWVRANVAWWTGEAGDAAGARELFEEVSTMRERISGPEHPATHVVRNNLAYWTGLAGNPAAARDQTASLLQMRRRVLGDHHPEVLLCLENLARWTGEAGDAAGAVRLYGELLAYTEEHLGPTDSQTVQAREELERWARR
jgi:hypothetical protein